MEEEGDEVRLRFFWCCCNGVIASSLGVAIVEEVGEEVVSAPRALANSSSDIVRNAASDVLVLAKRLSVACRPRISSARFALEYSVDTVVDVDVDERDSPPD